MFGGKEYEELKRVNDLYLIDFQALVYIIIILVKITYTLNTFYSPLITPCACARGKVIGRVVVVVVVIIDTKIAKSGDLGT